MLFSLALFVILNDRLLGMESITPWPVLGTALLGSIGLNLLFPGFGKRRILRNAFRGCGGKGLKSIVAIEGEHSGRVESYDHNGANVSCENAFGESVRYVSGEIGWVNLDNAFGTLQVYFTEAYLQGGRADVSLDVAFGKTVLYVPSNWKVNLSLDKAFGSIRGKRTARAGRSECADDNRGCGFRQPGIGVCGRGGLEKFKKTIDISDF